MNLIPIDYAQKAIYAQCNQFNKVSFIFSATLKRNLNLMLMGPTSKFIPKARAHSFRNCVNKPLSNAMPIPLLTAAPALSRAHPLGVTHTFFIIRCIFMQCFTWINILVYGEYMCIFNIYI